MGYFFTRGGTALQFTSLLQDKRLTILLSGEIDHHCAREIMAAITAKIDVYRPLCCILDFGGVGFMDSSGIAVVIHALRAMRELEGRLLLENIPDQPRKVLRTAGVGKLVAIGEESAV